MTAVATYDGSALLVGEAHHRFFNSLQLIVSATNGILRGGGCDPEARERLQALQERVTLLAEVNRLLSGPFGPEAISQRALHRLCADLAASFERTDVTAQIEVRGEAVTPEKCRILVLLVGELTTNALKHGVTDHPLLIGIDLIVSLDRCRLVVTSTMSGGRKAVACPRISEELARAAGGTLDAEIIAGEFRVTVNLPSA